MKEVAIRFSESAAQGSHLKLGRITWCGVNFAPLGFTARQACPFVSFQSFLRRLFLHPNFCPPPKLVTDTLSSLREPIDGSLPARGSEKPWKTP